MLIKLLSQKELLQALINHWEDSGKLPKKEGVIYIHSYTEKELHQEIVRRLTESSSNK